MSRNIKAALLVATPFLTVVVALHGLAWLINRMDEAESGLS
jgi:hypothetical protein